MTRFPGNGRDVPIETRLWSAVDIRGPDECWPWTKSADRSGYGKIMYLGKRTGTHRIAYLLTHGEIDGPVVRHTCDNPLCCNPAHLVAGTHRDNMRDASERGRIGGSKPLDDTCRSGHPRTEENVYIAPGGKRRCRACNRATARRLKPYAATSTE